MTQDSNHTIVNALRAVIVAAMVSLTGTQALADGVVVKGNVYGGGNKADVKRNTEVNICATYDETNQKSVALPVGDGITIEGSVFGGGKGVADNFTCDKAMVGENNSGETVENYAYGNTTVRIGNGTIGTGTTGGDVYGGGEIGRVEMNTTVEIGSASGTSEPIIKGHVFGAGKGLETHGYSALVRGNSTVTIQAKAHVWQNVHGGGEKASVGRYYVAQTTADANQYNVRIGMPCYLKAGGTCTVNIQDEATIGKEANSGDVYGAGQGVTPIYNNDENDENRSKRMVFKSSDHNDSNRDLWDYYADEDGNVDTRYVWEYFNTKDDYLLFVETLGRASDTDVVIGGKRETTGESVGSITVSSVAPTVKGTVYGGSESGFVYHNTVVNIKKGTIKGDAFGGGKGLLTYAEAGRVRRNTNLTISDGTVEGNVYGGGSLGDVGTITKPADYNYLWKQTDGSTGNVAHHNTNNTADNTGICTVTISGGTIGTSGTVSTEHGNVFGAGQGSSETWWCEKAIAYATSVTVSGGTVNGTVYGGGEVGRVEDDAKVVIGVADATGDVAPTIMGSVFGAGAGLHTHGYSALVRGNSDVIVQGTAQVGGSVYGGGETASVGRFTVVGGLPKHPDSGGYCTVTIQDNAKIGTSGLGHNVFGACKGVDPADISTSNRKSMQLRTNAPDDTNLWSSYNGDDTSPFIWRYYATDDDYSDFLKTLALTSHPHVTISENATVYGSVYGGGQRGVTLGNVDVDITGGTIEDDVYGGGALADTNCGNWDADSYTEVTGLTAGASLTGLYTKTVVEGKDVYTEIEDENATYTTGTYYSKGKWHDTAQMTALYTTTVDLTGGTIKGDAYGGGLGQKTGFDSATSDIAAVVWGDISVSLGSNGGSTATSFYTTYEKDNDNNDVLKSGRVFGCNNLLGSPQGDVTVTVWTTVDGKDASGETITKTADKSSTTESDHTYRLAAVYGGGNLAPYEASGKKAHVIIHGCSDTSILTVYGGGNAAAVPETDVDVYSAYEIGALFGGGNGKDKYKKGNTWQINPGANVNGNANTMIYGGTVHEAYGGSNEKGTITGDVAIDVGTNAPGETCTLDVAKLVGAGKNADVNGDLKIFMGCKPTETIPLVYGGADNANVNGNVELTITSGNFTNVVGGNNAGGAIKGHIILNIEETTCIPINIENLYLCGYNAAYSEYGYYIKTEETEAVNGNGTGASGETAILSNGKLQFMPRESMNDPHLPVNTYTYDEAQNKWTWTTSPITGQGALTPYASPVLNIISCTSIDKVFGGGYGTDAAVYGNPTVNINMIPGAHADEIDRDGDGNTDGDAHALGAIGNVYGGGDKAAVYGNTTVNIGTATTVDVYEFAQENGSGEWKLQYENGVPKTNTENVEGAYITGNVYGGGSLADVTGNTFINVCAKQVAVVENNEPTGEFTYNVVNYTETDYQGVIIGGNVYGGGEGYAKMEEGTAGEAFLCAKAMIGVDGEGIEDSDNNGVADHPDGGTSVVIGNGTVTGNVYGGGMVGRVEKNTKVTIGIGEGTGNSSATSTPVVIGNVFGAGAGTNTHGYSALVRGTSTVLVEGDAKVRGSVYGGGEKASVGRYRVDDDGLPVALNNALAPTSGYCYVTIRGYAEIGPDDMEMTKAGGPSDAGHVFGACQGVLPYDDYAADAKPFHMNGKKVTDGWEDEAKTYPAYNANADLDADYAKFIKSLALATQTLVTIEGNPFIKGSVYGGSENGYVQKDTRVVISGGQIGNGYVQMDDNGNYLDNPLSVNRRYTATEWSNGYLDTTNDRQALKDLVSPDANTHYYTSSLPECASWQYGTPYAPYDKFADSNGNYPSGSAVAAAEGGRPTGSDGHTFYGNVFGGGSGYYPYKPGRWFEDAGAVYGNTQVDITGGHILTNIYGGNEMTNVGVVGKENSGKCTINFGGTATLGVPRTLKQIDAHPVTCYLFGAGKGDQRVFFNKSTNVIDVVVNVTGGTIYGSVFGGGEDGHVLRDVTMTIGTEGVGDAGPTGPAIGTWGTSYVDGNVFGGGRGFGGDAYTAGNVAGSVTMDIKGGSILGSIYGGGRLGSVGYGLFDEKTNGVTTPGYGEMRKDTDTETDFSTSNFFTKGRGHIDITISGGTIGNTHEYIIPKTGEGGNTPNTITETDFKKWTAAQWTTWKEQNNIPKTEFDTTTGHLMHTKGGNVFAGGMGRFYQLDGSTAISSVDWWKLGNVKSTKLTITGGNILSNVYGGGELGMVQGGSHTSEDNKTVSTEIIISGGTIGTDIADYTFGSVFGGGYGSLIEKFTHTGGKPDSYPKYIAGRVKGSTEVTISGSSIVVKASVYGGGEMAAVGESKVLSTSTDPVVPGETLTGENGAPVVANTYVTINGGTIGIEPVTISGSNRRYFGGAKMGNVYGGGSGDNNTVRSGHVYGNTNVTISGESTRIYHNVYGGGAYGTVGDFDYNTKEEQVTVNNQTVTVKKVSGIKELKTSGTGVATVTITNGTIGYDGKENGMIFGSSRGDINQPEERDDYTAWVYNANVTIGTAGTPASGTEGQEGYVPATNATGPKIKGSVYGGGENGHTFNNTVVTVNGGKIGIDDSNDDGYSVTSNGKTYEGAAYPYRGNVYGGGCGTDKYYSNHSLENHSGEGDTFNALAGIVYGETKVYIKGGEVVRNVYGAGAMGSVGRTVTTTNSDNSTTTTYSGGSTTINVSGGVIGVSGTVGDGNVFGAARGDLSATGDYISQVRLTNVTVSGGTVKGNVYGGGELGDVGTIDKSDQTDYNYYWTDKDGSANIHGNNGISGTNNNTGICTVTVSGGTIGTDATTMNADGTFDNGNVFGAGKGSGSTWWCEKAIAYGTNVTVTAGTVKGSVYGGGEVGRVEDDAKVTIGSAPNDVPTINGSVFGAGKGLKTHGYSALVRGNAEVIVQGKSVVRGSVYGGGEIASVGRFHVDKGLPVKPMNGGTCKVLIQDEAQIGSSGTGHNVFGACKGVKSAYDLDNYKNFKSMQTEANGAKGTEGTDWDYYENYPQGYTGHKFVWKYYTTEAAYLSFLKTLALTSNTHVTIDEDASVYGSVFGCGERGVTLGGVDVNITGGTVNEDVYGGGSLADSNVAMWNSELNQRVTWVALPELIAGTSATGYYTAESADALITDPDAVVQSNTIYYANYKTNVNLKDGTVNRNVYGGGLGQFAKAAVAGQDAVLYADADEYNTDKGTSLTAADFEALSDAEKTKTPAVEAQAAESAVAAKVYGDVLVKLNEDIENDKCEVKGTIFGCNNLNGSPQSGVTVHVYKTVRKNDSGNVMEKPTKDDTTYEMTAVYGGGNLAAFYPDDVTTRGTAKANVIIDGCDLTSIGSVYGGGNAASVPATAVVVNGTYEIGDVFGGGNGKDHYQLDGVWYQNPGANVGLENYTHRVTSSVSSPGTKEQPYYLAENNTNTSDREARSANYGYGSGMAHATIYGGTVHRVYGGSNTRGNVRVESRTTLEDRGCDFTVGEAYGGGNNAPQDGNAVLEAGCIQGLDIAYGGASNADVNGDVILNLTNGTYGRVFGGNNLGGVIRGTITVNIEETGCRPIVIGQLYGGGNLAPYSVENIDRSRTDINFNDQTADNYYKNFPKVNVKSFTSIGTIFGGGFGVPATLEGNPQVNVNVHEGKYYNTFKGSDNVINDNAKVVGSAVKYSESDAGYANGYPIPSHAKGAIGAINDVFGGGNEAKVIGNPTVNIGTEAGEEVYAEVYVKTGESVEGYYTSSINAETGAVEYTATAATDVAVAGTTYYLKTVKAVDIRGNVFGGGNNAEVEGDTNVVIGKKKL